MTPALCFIVLGLALGQADVPPSEPAVSPTLLVPRAAPPSALSASRRVRLVLERDALLAERPSVGAPIVMMSLSAAAGLLFAADVAQTRGSAFYVFNSPSPQASDVVELVLVLALAVTHVTLGVVGSVLLPQAIKRRDETDQRVRQIDLELAAAGPSLGLGLR